MDLFNVFILALAGGVLSLTGGLILVNSQRLAKSLSLVAAPFAAGALIAAVFFDILPEALLHGKMTTVFSWLIVGIMSFFILERRLNWFHHHHDNEADKNINKRIPAMLITGDTIHNAIDGIAIAVAYIANPSLGLITAVAVALHEIPQEIADFGLLLKSGWTKKRVLIVNVLSALVCVIAAVLTYIIGSSLEQIVTPALGLVAGMLLYIALSDVLPSVHDTKNDRKWLDKATVLFISGIVVVWGAITITHNAFDIHDHGSDSHSEVDSDHNHSDED